MSGRGRGWRGRGRGQGPEIKDDDGSVVNKDLSAPPPLFPDVGCIDASIKPSTRVEITDETAELRVRQRRLEHAWRTSPFFLELPKPGAGGFKRRLEDFDKAAASKTTVDINPIFKVITLNEDYFPAELFSQQDHKISQRAASAAPSASYFAKAKQATDAQGQTELLMAKLSKMENVEEPAKEEEPREEEEEPVDEFEEMDDEEMNEDDYMQGAEYDDDDGYEEDFGGADDEAVF